MTQGNSMKKSLWEALCEELDLLNEGADLVCRGCGDLIGKAIECQKKGVCSNCGDPYVNPRGSDVDEFDEDDKDKHGNPRPWR